MAVTCRRDLSDRLDGSDFVIASMMLTSTVEGLSARSTVSALNQPFESTCRYVTLKPSRSNARQGRRTDLCSTVDVTTSAPRLALGPRMTPNNARLLASVAPLVKTSSLASAPIADATCSRAASTAWAASMPKPHCTLDALP